MFRYTTSFAHRLAKAVHEVVPAPSENARIAYICCPTGYIAAQNTHQSATTLLLEYDQRFAVAAASSSGGRFVHYDLEADNIPNTIKGTVELAVVDPPYLNEVGSIELLLKVCLHDRRIAGHEPALGKRTPTTSSPYQRQARPHYIHFRCVFVRSLWLGTAAGTIATYKTSPRTCWFEERLCMLDYVGWRRKFWFWVDLCTCSCIR